jgi:hypothetical protein
MKPTRKSLNMYRIKKIFLTKLESKKKHVMSNIPLHDNYGIRDN